MASLTKDEGSHGRQDKSEMIDDKITTGSSQNSHFDVAQMHHFTNWFKGAPY